jgi:hypothetical protein
MGNILNLVYQKLNEYGKPIPNLYDINEKKGYELVTPFQVLSKKKLPFEVKYRAIDEVNVDEKFYFIINHNTSIDNFINGDDWEIPHDIEECVRNKNLNIIFISEWESYYGLEDTIKNLMRIIDSKNLKQEQFFIINNNSNLNDYKNTLNSNINFIKLNYVLENISQSSTYNKFFNVDFVESKKFLFLCHNRRPKNHRISLLTLLNHYHLLDENIMDWSSTHTGEIKPFNYLHSFSLLGNSELSNDFKKMYLTLKKSYFEQHDDCTGDPNSFHEWSEEKFTQYKQSYINITTESHYEMAETHITEKTFKPFYFFQLPIILSSFNHIKHLRNEHDLYLFDDIIDHSYDNELNNTNRIYMVANEIKRLSKMEDDIKKYYKSNKSKLEHNHNYVKDFHLKNKTINIFKNLIE